MPLVTAARFPGLFAQPSNRGLTEGINQAFGHVSDTMRLNKIMEAKANQATLDNRAGLFQYLRGIEDPDKRYSMFMKLANDAAARKEPGMEDYYGGIGIDNPDEFGLYLSTIATRRGAEPIKGVAIGENERLANPHTGATMGPEPQEKQFPWQQGAGDMAGWAFNPNTGGYVIDSAMRSALDADAAKKSAEEGMLDSKKIVDVNDKVTGLTKDVNAIVEAAKQLDVLKTQGSPAAKVAAIVKFMKVNDPRSTVRESEFGTIVGARGAWVGFQNQINKILGEGVIGEQGFQDLVDTAKAIANSSINQASEVTNGYLDVLADKIPERDLALMRARIPSAFTVEIKRLADYTPEELNAMAPDRLRAIKNRELGLQGIDE